MKKNKTMFRQGDVLIMQDGGAEKLPEVPRDKDRVVLAYGEVTGHAHAITEKGVTLFRMNGQALTARLVVSELLAKLRHEEHREISIPKGKYKVIQQRQWTLARIRRVVD